MAARSRPFRCWRPGSASPSCQSLLLTFKSKSWFGVPGDELLVEPRIVVTPHIGGGTADIGDVIMPMLAQDIIDYSENKKVKHIVNQKYLTA